MNKLALISSETRDQGRGGFVFKFAVSLSTFAMVVLGLSFIPRHADANEVAPPDTNYSAVIEGLKRRIEKAGLSKDKLGLAVTSPSGQLIFGLNETKSMTPASITKILTGAAALEEFPAGHQFETLLMSDASINGKTLDGSIYLKGGGDPSFVSEKMWFLVNELTRTGITQIKGDVVVDDSLFDKVRVDDDRDPNRVDRAYDAPVGAMSFNWNSVNVYIRPGRKIGDPAVVTIDPENSYITLRSRAVTAKTGGKPDLNVSRVSPEAKSAKKSGGIDIIEVSGKIGVNNPEVVIYKSITQPDYWSGYNLVSFLAQRGIEVTGQVRTGVTPASAVMLAKAPSVPISQIVTDMMKFSNNYVAEMLTKNLARLKGSKPGTMKAGLEAVREFAKQHGIQSKDFNLVNASGLTLENRITASDMGRVLVNVQGKFQHFPEFLSSFPIAGVDGTLKNRFRGTSRPPIRGKTGLMKVGGVSSLAGYAARSDGQILSFVFMYNNENGIDVDRLWRFFDDLAAGVALD
jgi:D-alanyl-D-alanine carboxypeptidase/D-alanyl-D-alanine-endopeptidase (penicillin-binding protein 4)